MTADIVAAYVEGNNVAATDLPALIQNVHRALSNVGPPAKEPAAEEINKPTAAQIRKSVQDEYLVSFLDGGRYKTLKRHLTTNGLTLAEYKVWFGLPADYPTTAPSYSRARSEMAKSAGLGTKGGPGRAPAKPAPKKSKT